MSKNLTADFMTLPGAGVAKAEKFQGGLYAAVPGGGPIGERCNTCKRFVGSPGARYPSLRRQR